MNKQITIVNHYYKQTKISYVNDPSIGSKIPSSTNVFKLHGGPFNGLRPTCVITCGMDEICELFVAVRDDDVRDDDVVRDDVDTILNIGCCDANDDTEDDDCVVIFVAFVVVIVDNGSSLFIIDDDNCGMIYFEILLACLLNE